MLFCFSVVFFSFLLFRLFLAFVFFVSTFSGSHFPYFDFSRFYSFHTSVSRFSVPLLLISSFFHISFFMNFRHIFVRAMHFFNFPVILSDCQPFSYDVGLNLVIYFCYVFRFLLPFSLNKCSFWKSNNINREYVWWSIIDLNSIVCLHIFRFFFLFLTPLFFQLFFALKSFLLLLFYSISIQLHSPFLEFRLSFAPI